MFLLNIKIEILVHNEKNSFVQYQSFPSFYKVVGLPLHVIYSLSSKLRRKYLFNR